MQLGVDVSHYQEPAACDYRLWGATEHTEFVIARASYGTKADTSFVSHFARAREAGLAVGAYCFYRQSQDWQAQHATFQEQLRRVRCGVGNIVPAVDLEWNDTNDGPVNKKKFNEEGRQLCERLAADYGKCIVYFAPAFYDVLGKPSWLLDHSWWIAHYTKDAEPWSLPGKDWSLWQYTGKGRLAGYTKDLDLNRARELPFISEVPRVPLLPIELDWEELQRDRDAEIRDKDE
jgi:lysozyme